MTYPMRKAVSMIVTGLLPIVVLAGEVPVRTEVFGDIALYPEFSASAEVMTQNVSELSAETAARIVAIEQLAGDAVKKGDVLVRLDCRHAQSRLRQTQAELKNHQARRAFAAKQYDRMKRLEQNVSAEEREQRRLDLDTLTADIQAIEARIEQQQIEIENCEIKAPFDGIVIERLTTEGEYAHVGAAIIKLVDTESPEVEAGIRTSQAGSLEIAEEIDFVEAGQRYPVKLRALIPLIAKRTRTRPARFSFVGDPAFVGSNGRVVWKSTRPFIPSRFIVRRDGVLGIMLYESGLARFHPLADAHEGQSAALDLPLETVIIVHGQQALNDGTPVRLK